MLARLYYTVIAILVLSNCNNYKPYNMDFEYEPVPVVHSLIDDENLFTVMLLWSADPQKKHVKFDTIKDGDIRLYENSISIGNLIYVDSLGRYAYNNFIASQGNSYKIEVTIPNYEYRVSAETNMPFRTIITNVDPPQIGILDQSMGIYSTEEKKHILTLESLVIGEIQYYEYLSTFGHEAERSWHLKLTDPAYYKVKEFYSIPAVGNQLFDNRYFIDGKTSIELTSTAFDSDDAERISESKANLLTMSEDMYMYLSSLPDYYKGGIDGDGIIPNEAYSDPKIIYSNIEGAVGIFGAYTKSEFMLELK